MPYFDLPPMISKMLSVAEDISDLNFTVGKPPQAEVNGKLLPVPIRGMDQLKPYHTEIIALSLIGENPEACRKLLQNGAVDISFSLPNRVHFRVNIFQQRGNFSIVMRVIPSKVPTLASLGLPLYLGDISKLRNGIVLVTGPTGSGKSSTLAAIIDQINENISKFADGKKIRYLNINKQLADNTGKLFEGMFNRDKLHLNVEGYQVWADALKPIFTELLGPPANEDHAPLPTGDPSTGKRTAATL